MAPKTKNVIGALKYPKLNRWQPFMFVKGCTQAANRGLSVGIFLEVSLVLYLLVYKMKGRKLGVL